jgi:pimeloyl-ACP methyl ester carboxylesterase
MRPFRALLGLVLLALLGVGLFIMAVRGGWLRPDEAEMRQRYALPASRFETIGAQALHVVDEGSGPPVILVHGSFASLRMWQAWADALKGHYRVIRFDRPGMGLSGPNPQGRYDGDAEAELIGKLADHLKLGRFVLVGTSSSGEGVAHYAALHPDRISAVVLANIAAGPLAPAAPHYGPWFRTVLAVEPWLGGWHTQALWRGVLENNFADRALVTPALVREWTDLNNRAQGWPRSPRPGGAKSFAGTPADLAAITAPALVLWSDKDPEVPLERDGKRTMELLGSSDKSLTVIANCGHMMPQECGPDSARHVLSFLNRITAEAK